MLLVCYFHALTNLNVLEQPDALADKLKELEPTKEKYAEIKEQLVRWDYTRRCSKIGRQTTTSAILSTLTI